MHNFRELKIWQESMDLAKKVFTITRNFPEQEKYGLISQMNRRAVSIPSNIAEGSGRGSKKEVAQFLNIAVGSCYELETQVTLAKSLEYILAEDFNNYQERLVKLQRMIIGFKKSLLKE